MGLSLAYRLGKIEKTAVHDRNLAVDSCHLEMEWRIKNFNTSLEQSSHILYKLVTADNVGME